MELYHSLLKGFQLVGLALSMDLSRFIPPILVGFSVLIQSENSSILG